MTPTEFATYIRQKTKTNTTTFPDAEILVSANAIKDELAAEITEADEDYFGIELLRNLVADQRNYALPTDLQKIKYLEAKLDGTNWKHLEEEDITSLDITTDEAGITNYFSERDPAYEIMGKELTVYSGDAIIDVTDGLKLKAIIFPADLSSLSGSDDMSVPPSTTSFGIPRAFHKLWADAVVIEYKEAQDTPLPLTRSEANWDNRLKKALKAVKKLNLDRPGKATTPYDDGQDY